MPKRGPKPKIVLALEPARRAELDRAIIEGRETKAALHQRFAKPNGIGYRSFCNYASQLEILARNEHVGRLIAEAFGNRPNSDFHFLARGITHAVLTHIAADLSANNTLSPRDLNELVKTCNLLQKTTLDPRRLNPQLEGYGGV